MNDCGHPDCPVCKKIRCSVCGKDHRAEIMWSPDGYVMHRKADPKWRYYCPECRRSNKGMLKKAIRSSEVGKKMPNGIYVHWSALQEAPDHLSYVVRKAKQIVYEKLRVARHTFQWDVVKISRDGSKVSFLMYPGFFQIRNPVLVHSVNVNFDTGKVTGRNYGNSRNPPVLHRKEETLHRSHYAYDYIAKQTAEDEALGLLSRSDIGNLQGWVKAQQEVSNG